MPIDFRKPQYFKEFRFGNNLIWNTIKKFLNTFTGEIVRFFSEESEPMVKLEANFTPIQDLNGYDSPWPPGGGKNKLLVDTVVHDASTAEIVLWEGSLTGTYTLSADASGITTDLPNAGMLKYIVDGTQTIRVSKNNPKETITGTITKVSAIAATSYSRWQGTCKFQMESGSTPTAWTPSSNICPISGHTGCDVVRTGINVWDEEWEVGTINASTGADENNSSRIRSKNYIPIKPETEYCFVIPTISGGSEYQYTFRVVYYDSNKNYLSGTAYFPNGESTFKPPSSFTTPSNAYYMRFSPPSNYGTTYNHDISINYPSTDHDYHAFVGTTVSISFGQTVYGGKLTVNEDGSGQVVADRAIITANGTESWTKPDNCFKTESLHADSDYPQGISNTYTVATSYSAVNGNNNRIAAHSTWFRIHDERFSTTDAFKTYLSENNVQFVYKLATPITIPLTASQINTLVGENNVWVDAATGDITVQAYGTEIT